MPQHQPSYHQQPQTVATQQVYRQSQQQQQQQTQQQQQPPTIITVPIPPSAVGNQPVTIHLSLPDQYQLAPQQHLTQMQMHSQPVQLISTGGEQFGNGQHLQVIRIQPPTSNSHGSNPQQIIIQPQQLHAAVVAGNSRAPPPSHQQHPPPPPSTSRGHTVASTSASNAAAAAAAALNRAVPHRFRNLTDEQIARRRKANADRSRRRRAQESTEQRAERNRRTAERMRQRRAKIAEERGIVRTEPRSTTLSADRFEEIYQSVVKRNAEESAKEAHGTADAHSLALRPSNDQQQQQQQLVNGIPTSSVTHMIVNNGPHQASTQPVILTSQPYRNQDGPAFIYQTSADQQAPQPLLLQAVKSDMY